MGCGMLAATQLPLPGGAGALVTPLVHIWPGSHGSCPGAHTGFRLLSRLPSGSQQPLPTGMWTLPVRSWERSSCVKQGRYLSLPQFPSCLV